MDCLIEQENYRRIAKGINYICQHSHVQPSLEEVAREAGLSPHHFQRLFVQGTGISPKKFLQYTTLGKTRSYLRTQTPTLFDTAHTAGLSGTGRLHDLFIKFEAMTPAEFRDYGNGLEICYHSYATPFGEILVASTARGICRISFLDDRKKGLEELRQHYPAATLQQREQPEHLQVLQWFGEITAKPKPLHLHLRGTPFQLQVWQALLKIPEGTVTTYGELATTMGKPDASRATGTAIGANPVAFLIPCHRVIRADGNLGGYMWGTQRKQALLDWEQARNQKL